QERWAIPTRLDAVTDLRPRLADELRGLVLRLVVWVVLDCFEGLLEVGVRVEQISMADRTGQLRPDHVEEQTLGVHDTVDRVAPYHGVILAHGVRSLGPLLGKRKAPVCAGHSGLFRYQYGPGLRQHLDRGRRG